MSEEELYALYLAETNQSTDADLYQQYLAEVGGQQQATPQLIASPQGEQFNPAESALQGFGSGLTLGYLPRIQAATEAALDPELTYEQTLPRWQKREQMIQAEDPVSFIGGNIGGALAMPGLGAVKGATALAKAGKAAAQGAALGAASDTGQNVGSDQDLRSRLERAVGGGVLGGSLQGLGSSISKAGAKLKEDIAFKLIGARGKDAEKLLEKNKKKLRDVENFLDEEGIVGPLTTNADLAKRTDKIAKETGKEIGEVYSKIQAKGEAIAPPHPEDMANDFMAKASIDLEGTANGNEILSALDKQIQNLKKVSPEKGLGGIVEFRKSLDDALKKTYEKPFADVGEKQEAMMTLRRYLKGQTDQYIDSVSSPDAKKLKKLNERFSNASTVSRMTAKAETADIRNNLFGLPELIVGGATGGAEFVRTGDPNAAAKGIAAGAAFKLGRKYGAPMSYRTGAALKEIPTMPTSVATVPWLTMTKENK